MNPITLFPTLWHRRAASITFVGSLVVLSLLSYVFYVDEDASEIGLITGISVTLVAVLMSALSLLPTPDRAASWFGFLGFAFGAGGAGLALLTHTTVDIHIVFILVLSIYSVTAGLYGPTAWLIIIAVLTPYTVQYSENGGFGMPSDIITFAFLYALPLAASWLLWHGGSRRHVVSTNTAANDVTYSTLAEQLDQVSGESDIVINTIADGVVSLTERGEIHLINPAAQALLGWSKRDSLGLDYHSVIRLQNVQGSPITDDMNPIFITLHTGKMREQSDLYIQTASNKSFQTRISVSSAGRAGSGVIVVFRDITAEKAEEREQAEFVSTASHEMRTPVAAIEGYLGLALNPNTAVIDDKARQYLAKAHESAQHLGRLFQDLLDVTRVDDGRLRNSPSVTDLVTISADIVGSLVPKATDKGLSLAFTPLGDNGIGEHRLTPVYYADVDCDHLREVLGNLVENAIKYTKTGEVVVNIAGDSDSVEITVRDSGIGIPREDIPHLFQKFYRVDNSDTREIGGTGLGLYLSRRLVELMGGKIWVDSDYGHGSVFTLSLPRLDFESAQIRLQALAEQRERQAANEASKAAAYGGAAPQAKQP